MTTSIDGQFFLESLSTLLQGLGGTLVYTGAAFALAMTVGLGIAILQMSLPGLLRRALYALTEVIRRTPVLLQLYFLFFVLPDIGVLLPSYVAGIVGLGLHYACYTAEVYRAGIGAVEAGQSEAAIALNYSRFQIWSRVILPQAIPPMIPALGNYLIALFKDTAILYAISVVDLMAVARAISNETYRYLEIMTLVGILYLAVSLPAAALIRMLGRRYKMPEYR